MEKPRRSSLSKLVKKLGGEGSGSSGRNPLSPTTGSNPLFKASDETLMQSLLPQRSWVARAAGREPHAAAVAAVEAALSPLGEYDVVMERGSRRLGALFEIEARRSGTLCVTDIASDGFLAASGFAAKGDCLAAVDGVEIVPFTPAQQPLRPGELVDRAGIRHLIEDVGRDYSAAEVRAVLARVGIRDADPLALTLDDAFRLLGELELNSVVASITSKVRPFAVTLRRGAAWSTTSGGTARTTTTTTTTTTGGRGGGE
jgi:hypothetical protein